MIKKFLVSLFTIYVMALPSLAQEHSAVNHSESPIKNCLIKVKKFTTACKNKITNTPDTTPLPKVMHQNIAIIPVNVSTSGEIQSIYTNTLGLISEDISNTLNKSPQLTSPHLMYIEEKIKLNNLEPTLNSFLLNYKSRYLVDYKALQLIAETLKVDKIVLISGDFNTNQFFLQPNLAYQLDVPEVSVLKPSYQIQTSATFIDPKNQVILWEKVYTKNLEISEFGMPSINFANNVIPVREIKNFSKEITPKIVRNIYFSLPTSRIQSQNANMITTQNFIKKSNLKDGVTTTDGHSYSTNTRKLELERKQKYSEWVQENL